MLKFAILILIGTFISSVSQVLLKKSAMKTYSSRKQEYLNPLVISAYAMFVLATLLSVMAYRGIPLSMGPILEATSYVYVTIFGARIFHETVDKRKLTGLCLIICGILVYSLFG
ncbi:MAG: EamA family transporter [Bulleidia sp.]|nr:EamA family transporter [Bulleidia sp.]